MGLLDDAIREHLELKRLKGDDPGEVAREEREALGPAQVEDQPIDLTTTTRTGPDLRLGNSDDPHHEDDAEAGASNAREGGYRPTAGQETIEIDMATVLGSDGPQVGGDTVQAGGFHTPAQDVRTGDEPPLDPPGPPGPR